VSSVIIKIAIMITGAVTITTRWKAIVVVFWMAIFAVLTTSSSIRAFVVIERPRDPIVRPERKRMSTITSKRKKFGMMMMITTMISSRHSVCLFQQLKKDDDDNNNNNNSSAEAAINDNAATMSSLYTEKEIQEMTDLIVSLSLEATDHDRRMRVKDVFVEALARPNGMPQRFCDLFDNTLTQVGDQVQTNAKKKFFEQQQQQFQNDDRSDNDADVELPIKDGELRLKSPEELQLWALVDMMVQSKTIVKKRNGELGSKGTFR
jgi:hypothetical protein